MLKIFHANGGENYSNWMGPRKIVYDLEDADLVLFEGGEDVCPRTYGEKIGSYVNYNIARDLHEKRIFDKAVKLNKKIWGTCRGSQLISALSGGRVIQHQSNPGFIHPIFTSVGRLIDVSSTHHNAMNPYPLPKEDYKILGWTENMCKMHLNGEDKESYLKNEKEVEICYFKKTNALGFQGHPEMLYKHGYDKTIDYCRELLDGLLTDTL